MRDAMLKFYREGTLLVAILGLRESGWPMIVGAGCLVLFVGSIHDALKARQP